MSKIIINGLIVHTEEKYIMFKVADHFSVEVIGSILTIKFPRGFRSSQVVQKGFELFTDTEIKSTPRLKVVNPIININGLILKKLVLNDYLFDQILVDDIKDFTMDYSESSCTLLIPKHRAKLEEYVGVLSKNPFLEVIECNIDNFYNVYNLLIRSDDVCINSKNDMIFDTKATYDRYLISDVEVINSFLKQLKSILNSYGIELVKYPLDSTSNTANRLIYKITELGKQESHVSGSDQFKDEMIHKTTIDFEGTFVDMMIYEDFRVRYQNFDLLRNFTEFYTPDRIGNNWISSVKWSELPTDFNQDFNNDNLGNNAYTLNINCELSYYVVYDRLYRAIKCIINNVMINKGGSTNTLVGINEGFSNNDYKELRNI